MVKGNVKVQTGLRVDKLVLDSFKELCRQEKLLAGEAVQHLMKACLKSGSVTSVLKAEALAEAGQRKADELKLKGALAELRGFTRAVKNREWYVTVKDRQTRIDRAIYQPAYETAVATLPKIRDEELIRETEKVLEKANKAVIKAIG